jgi:hypothetical protein
LRADLAVREERIVQLEASVSAARQEASDSSASLAEWERLVSTDEREWQERDAALQTEVTRLRSALSAQESAILELEGRLAGMAQREGAFLDRSRGGATSVGERSLTTETGPPRQLTPTANSQPSSKRTRDSSVRAQTSRGGENRAMRILKSRNPSTVRRLNSAEADPPGLPRDKSGPRTPHRPSSKGNRAMQILRARRKE